jgi:hypothetical protein
MAKYQQGSYVDRPGGRKMRPQVKVTLTCDHTIFIRLEPMRKTETYCCDRGLGCGYSLRWRTWEDTVSGRTGFNPESEGK